MTRKRYDRAEVSTTENTHIADRDFCKKMKKLIAEGWEPWGFTNSKQHHSRAGDYNLFILKMRRPR